MNSNFVVAMISAAIGFGGGVAFQQCRVTSPNRYQIVSGGAGNAFRHDTQTGDSWLITSTGEETLVLPPDAQVSLDSAKKVYETLRDSKIFEPGNQAAGNNSPQSLRDWAIQMNRVTAKDGRSSSGIYDAAAQRSSK